MTSPPWEPPRPPSGPPPGWHQPNTYGLYGGPGNPPPWPGPQWQPTAPPPSFGSPPPNPYGGFSAPPPSKQKSSKGWIIGISVAAALVLTGFGLVAAIGGGSRDEKSYQAGRSAAENGATIVKFGGGSPEDYCKDQFTLSTPLGEKSDFRRGDFMDGCVDALEEKLNRKP